LDWLRSVSEILQEARVPYAGIVASEGSKTGFVERVNNVCKIIGLLNLRVVLKRREWKTAG